MSLQSIIIKHNLPSTIVEDIITDCDTFYIRCRDICRKLEISSTITEKLTYIYEKLQADLHPLVYLYFYILRKEQYIILNGCKNCNHLCEILGIRDESQTSKEINSIFETKYCYALGEHCENKNIIPTGVYKIYESIASNLEDTYLLEWENFAY